MTHGMCQDRWRRRRARDDSDAHDLASPCPRPLLHPSLSRRVDDDDTGNRKQQDRPGSWKQSVRRCHADHRSEDPGLWRQGLLRLAPRAAPLRSRVRSGFCAYVRAAAHLSSLGGTRIGNGVPNQDRSAAAHATAASRSVNAKCFTSADTKCSASFGARAASLPSAASATRPTLRW